MHRIALRGAVVAATVAGLLAAGSTAANADPAPTAGGGAVTAAPGMKIVRQSGGATVSVPAGRVTDKAAWQDTYGQTVVPFSTINSYGTSGGPGGGSFSANGNTSLATSCGVWSCSAKYTGTHAVFTWWGNTPFLANQISGSTKWWVDGVAVGAEASFPGGVGFSISNGGSGITWAPAAVPNEWQETLDYPGRLTINGQLLTGFHFQDMADFQIGNGWYHVQGN
jgi:hypothetical protein